MKNLTFFFSLKKIIIEIPISFLYQGKRRGGFLFPILCKITFLSIFSLSRKEKVKEWAKFHVKTKFNYCSMNLIFSLFIKTHFGTFPKIESEQKKNPQQKIIPAPISSSSSFRFSLQFLYSILEFLFVFYCGLFFFMFFGEREFVFRFFSSFFFSILDP